MGCTFITVTFILPSHFSWVLPAVRDNNHDQTTHFVIVSQAYLFNGVSPKVFVIQRLRPIITKPSNTNDVRRSVVLNET